MRAIDYTQYCARLGVPAPPTPREHEHLSVCIDCQRLWPLFYRYQQTVGRTLTLASITGTWAALTEVARQELLPRLLRDELTLVRTFVKRRVPTAFQLFTKDMLDKHKRLWATATFGTKSQRVAALWKVITVDQQQEYRARSHAAKQARQVRLLALPKHTQTRIHIAKQNRRTKSRQSPHKRPKNPYVVFLNQRWVSEQQKPIALRTTYKALMCAGGVTWRNMQTWERDQYRALPPAEAIATPTNIP
jgi:hypothetical protein